MFTENGCRVQRCTRHAQASRLTGTYASWVAVVCAPMVARDRANRLTVESGGMNSLVVTRRRPTRGFLTFLLALSTVCGGVLLPPAPADAAGMTVTAKVSAATVLVNTPATFTGTISVDATGAVATLQRRVRGGGWMRTAPPVTVRGTQFEFLLPTSWYGTRVYRAQVVLAGSSTPVYSGTVSVKVSPRYTPAGTATAFKSIAGAKWVRWNPCAGPITYRVNTAKGYAGAVEDVKGAFWRIHMATGLRFKYLGPTSKLPTKLGTNQGDADILVMWATSKQFPKLDNTTVGLGGPYYASGWKETDGTSVWRVESGALWMNSYFNDLIPHGFGAGNPTGHQGTSGQIMLHELGHVFGLGHVSDSLQIMYTKTTNHLARYGAGDLRGFTRVGASQGCLIPA